jgi:hypothetical protein
MITKIVFILIYFIGLTHLGHLQNILRKHTKQQCNL